MATLGRMGLRCGDRTKNADCDARADCRPTPAAPTTAATAKPAPPATNATTALGLVNQRTFDVVLRRSRAGNRNHSSLSRRHCRNQDGDACQRREEE